MMTDRERLVGLVKEICNTVVKACGCSDMLPTYSFCKNAVYESIADYLITNGVTVQEWISVKDRLPKPFVSVLVHMPGEHPFPTVREGYLSADGTWVAGMYKREPGEVVKWMPLPEPPKEDNHETD